MRSIIPFCGFIAVIMLAPRPVLGDPCGGMGERACCWFCPGTESSNTGFACDWGLWELPIPDCGEILGAGNCGPTCWITGSHCSIGVCTSLSFTDPETCGGHGEWACYFVTCDPWRHMIGGLPLHCYDCGGEGQLECLNAPGGTVGCKPGFTGNPATGFATCTACGGEGQYVCLNFAQNNYGCKSGYTADPEELFLKCTECGGEDQIMCLNLLTGDRPCDYPWLRIPWYWPWDAGFIWPWESAFIWPWEDDFCWPWESCWLWPWEAARELVTCAKAWEPIAEPDCDVFDESDQLTCDAEEQTEDAPLFGIADTHVHPFSNLAFGGALQWGSPFDTRGVNYALAWGDYTWDFSTWTGETVLPNLRDVLANELPVLDHVLPEIGGLSVRTLPTPNGYLIHAAPMAVFMAFVNEEGAWHSTYGPPSFDHWPNWDSTMHQQLYYKWMQRAYKGGLRLMVMLAVNNEVSCKLSVSIRDGFGCTDMPAVNRQLVATWELEDFIDDQYGGAGKGWFQVVYTPEEARAAIRSGKMAVVLGIEVDALFDCYPDSAICTEEWIRDRLEDYYDLGVRHVFPLHFHDNAFGGAALYYWLWPWANMIATGNRMDLGPCDWLPAGPEKYDYIPVPFKETGAPPAGYPVWLKIVVNVLIDLAGLVWPDIPEFPWVTAWCNARDLTPKGEVLINEMMDQKFIIDVDHMSLNTLNTVLDMAEENDYPLISSHAFLFDKPLTEFGTEGARTEDHRTLAQIKRIRDLGGIVSPLPPRKKGSSTNDYVEMYNYIREEMAGGPYGPDHPGIGFGSDWGAMFQATAPRFVCDPKHTLNSEDPLYCTPCGGDGQPKCRDSGFACSLGETRDPETGDCVACGREGRLPCEYNGKTVCEPRYTPYPPERVCIVCGGRGQLSCEVDGKSVCDLGNTPAPVTRTCVACGDDGQLPCEYNESLVCDSGYTLDPVTGSCVECGGTGQPQCQDEYFVCDLGYTLDPETGNCVECGGEGQLACEYNGDIVCNLGYTLDPETGTCIECGGEGQLLCAYNGNVVCDFGNTPDPETGTCVECGGNGQLLCAFNATAAPPLVYPFTIEGVAGEFFPQKTGDRTFNYNADGLAHIGLLPDFIADVKRVGSTYDEEFDLGPLFNSAETYIRMWEKIEYCSPDTDPPVPDVDILPTITVECIAEVTAIPTASDRCYSAGQVEGTTDDPLVYSEQGTYTITWTYDDGNGNTTTQTQTVIVEDTTPPVFDPIEDVVVGNDQGECSAIVEYDAVATDDCGDPVVVCDPVSGSEFARGETTVECTATDVGDNIAVEEFVVTVEDREAPVVTGITEPIIIWPPNRKLVDFLLEDFVHSVSDNCTDLSLDDVVVARVTSDELESSKGPGDESSADDILISTDLKSVSLRAERQGNGNGRVYTVYFALTDDSGNAAEAPFQVHVPHSKKKAAVDDGPAYVVNGVTASEETPRRKASRRRR